MMYTNGTQTISGKKIEADGRVILNPTEEMLADAGWTLVEPTQPSEEELAEQARLAEIERLKQQLAETDYKAIKYAEGWISAEDYAPIKAERQALRDRINELEAEIDAIVEDIEEGDYI